MGSPKPKRRWFRFSLRTMFVAVTVLCCWLGWAMHWIKQRSEFAAVLRKHDKPSVGIDDDPKKWAPMGMSLLGERSAAQVHIAATDDNGLPRKEAWKEVQTAKKLFPEAQIYILFKDESGSWMVRSANEAKTIFPKH